jgi:hypothetical protein
LLTFLGETRKVSGCRAAPGKPSLIEENTTLPTSNQKQTNNQNPDH